MMGKLLKKKILIDILLIFILSLTPLLWFRAEHLMVGHDNVFPLDPKTFLKGRLYTWNQNQGFGMDQSLIMGTVPIHFIDALPFLLGFSLQTTQKLVYIFWFFLTGLSVYVLASLVNPKSRFFKLSVTIFYQFNFFILQGWFIGERTKFSAYIALPLVLSVFLLIYRGKIGILRAAIFNSLILFFFNAGGLFGIPLYGGFFVCVGAFVIYFSLLSIVQKKYQPAKALILVSILTLLGLLLLNSYYLFPVFGQFLSRYGVRLGEIGGVSGVLAWVREISVGASFINLFRLQGIAEWYDNPEHPYAKYFFTNPILILISFIFPLLVFSSLLLVKEKEKFKFVLYFFLVYLAGMFFTAGTHLPLGLFYRLFVQFIPGFAIFRTPYFKFAPALFIASSFLCAFTIDNLKERIATWVVESRKAKILPTIFCLFCLILIFGYHFPYFTGNFFDWREGFSTRLKVPEYIFNFSQWLEKEWAEDGRILMLPANNPDWQYEIYQWGYLSLQSLPSLFTDKPVLIIGEKLKEDERRLFNLLTDSLSQDRALFEKVAYSLGIKYLLVRNDFAYDVDWAKTKNPDFLKKIIVKDFGYRLKKTFGEWELYEIDPTPIPEIFAFQKIDRIDLPISFLEDYPSLYFALTKKYEGNFVLNQSLSGSEEMVDHFYLIPECLNCGHETGVHVVFPKTRILPDSLFYPLVTLREKRRAKEADVKGQIYNQIGLTLKRIGEIKRLVELKKEIKIAYLKVYLDNIETIVSLFERLEEYSEKIKISEDLNFFLEKERQFFSDLFPSMIREEEKVAAVKETIAAIGSLQELIDPWLFKKERSYNRLYSFSLPEKDSFKILLDNQSIKGAFPQAGELIFKIDDQAEKVVSINPAKLKNKTSDLGEVELEGGSHQIMLSFSALPNLVSLPKAQKEAFWEKVGTCFVSEIANYDPYKDYLLKFYYYSSHFPYEPRLFVLRLGSQIEKKERVQPLTIREAGFFIDIIQGDRKAEQAKVAICTPEFIDDSLFKERKIELEVKEIVYPLLFLHLKSPEISPPPPPRIEWRKINPTKYQIKVEQAQNPYFLSFWQKFDPHWKLYWQGQEVFQETHFPLNEYANSWLINKQGDYDLILKYFPQSVFYQGVGLSLISLVLMSGYLLMSKKHERKPS